MIDLETAIETYTPLYQLFLTDSHFWRACNSLQLDETVAIYTSRLMGDPSYVSLVNNKHPLVPMSTLQAGYRCCYTALPPSASMRRWCNSSDGPVKRRGTEQRLMTYGAILSGVAIVCCLLADDCRFLCRTNQVPTFRRQLRWTTFALKVGSRTEARSPDRRANDGGPDGHGLEPSRFVAEASRVLTSSCRLILSVNLLLRSRHLHNPRSN